MDKDRMILQKLSDLKDLNRPDYLELDSSYVITGGIIKKDDKVIASGRVKLLAEAILSFKEELTIIMKGRALELFMNAAVKECEENGVQQLHAFIEDKNFAKALISHFGFEHVEGIPLVLNLPRK